MKKLIFILIFILCSTLIVAEYGDIEIEQGDYGDYVDWADASWDRFLGWEDVGMATWKTDFYEVQDWEVEYCSKGVTTEFEFEDDDTASAFYESFFGTSATLQAFKSNTDETGLYLYEFTWYIKPMESDLNVNISYQVGTNKIQLDFKKVTEGSSWAIYKPFYSSENITFAYMTYSGNNFKTEVLPKND